MRLGQLAKRAAGDYWYIGQYNDYLQHRDKEAERDKLVALMTRPPRIRGWSWSASGANTCLRQRQFGYLGMPRRRPDDRTANIFANGDYMHLRHQAFGEIAGYIVASEVSVAMPQYNLLGTLDGVLSNGRGLELKSINTRQFSEVMTFGPKPDHVAQMHSYMLAGGYDAFHIIYEDKDKQHLKEVVVHRDEAKIKSVIEDLERLNEAVDRQQLLPMLPECLQGKGKFNWCDYRDMCEGATWPSGSLRLTPATSSSDAS